MIFVQMIAMNETVMEAVRSESKGGTREKVLANGQDIRLNSEKIAEMNETLLDSNFSPEIRDRDQEAKFKILFVPFALDFILTFQFCVMRLPR